MKIIQRIKNTKTKRTLTKKSFRIITTSVCAFAFLSMLITTSADSYRHFILDVDRIENPAPFDHEVEIMASSVAFHNPYISPSPGGIVTAAFRLGDRIYAAGHHFYPEFFDNAKVYKISPYFDSYMGGFTYDMLDENNHIGHITQNDAGGVIIIDNGQSGYQYVTVPVANEIEQGRAHFLIRDDETGKVRMVPLHVDFVMTQDGTIQLTYYLEDEWLISKGGYLGGTSGAPIVQNGKLIGVHWATASDDDLRGLAKVVWELDFFD